MTEYKPIVDLCLQEVSLRGEDAISIIYNCDVPRHVILVEYTKLKEKLEDLPVGEKQTMWQEVSEMFPDFNREERLKVCKIIHCVSKILSDGLSAYSTKTQRAKLPTPGASFENLG